MDRTKTSASEEFGDVWVFNSLDTTTSKHRPYDTYVSEMVYRADLPNSDFNKIIPMTAELQFKSSVFPPLSSKFIVTVNSVFYSLELDPQNCLGRDAFIIELTAVLATAGLTVAETVTTISPGVFEYNITISPTTPGEIVIFSKCPFLRDGFSCHGLHEEEMVARGASAASYTGSAAFYVPSRYYTVKTSLNTFGFGEEAGITAYCNGYGYGEYGVSVGEHNFFAQEGMVFKSGRIGSRISIALLDDRQRVAVTLDWRSALLALSLKFTN